MSSSIGKVFKNVISARQLPRLEWIFRSHGSWPGETWKHHKLCEPQLYQISQPWARVFLFSWISLEVIVQSQSLSFNNIKTLFIIECNLPQFDNFSPKTQQRITTQTIHRRGLRTCRGKRRRGVFGGVIDIFDFWIWQITGVPFSAAAAWVSILSSPGQVHRIPVFSYIDN